MADTFDNPVHQNLFGALATVLYVKAVVGGCEFAVANNILPSKISRKMIHVAAGSWIIFWPMFRADHWTWRFNVLVPAIYSIQLIVKGAIIRDTTDSDVITMTRTGNPTELLFGPLYFTLIMNFLGLTCFLDDNKRETAVLVMACLGYGDGMAPLAGGYFPFGYYKTYPFGPNDKKTISGSIGFCVASMIGYVVLRSIVIGGSDADNDIDFGKVFVTAATATVMEGITGPYDNPFIALTAYLAAQYYI